MFARLLTLLWTLSVLPSLALGEDLPTISKKTTGLTAKPGLLVTYVDGRAGKVYLELPQTDGTGVVGKYLYVESLETGLGSNDLGLDRTQIGATYVVNLREIGDRVLIEAENLSFRSDSTRPEEVKATKEGFATSVLWAGRLVARDPDGSALADITDFIVRDAHGTASRLQYQFEPEKSFLEADDCKSFPENLEFGALLTFHAANPSSKVGAHAPDARNVSLHQRHSIIRLPDDDYKPRPFDPRSGMFAIGYMDYASPLDEPLMKRFVTRFRLEKVDPKAARSPVKKPIVYYVDRGVPQPIRQALIDGGNYWKRAFDAAGFIDAFRVEEMPPGVDPLDIRYNVVQWMNRSTRGYAYGQSVVDPRTGEVLKGAVNLDSQRIRQDILIFESILGAQNTGTGRPDDPIQIALRRMRQLAAHEIGHTIGFAHNFAASTYADRASVMDYPAPLLGFKRDGSIDVGKAYAPGVGAWDVQAVRYGYTQFAPGKDERAGLSAILQDGIKKGLKFLSDEDANEADGADSDANRWDNFSDPLFDLRNTLAIRSKALNRFGENNLRKGAPVAELEAVFGPLYFLHRYDLDAVAKLIGGFHYVQTVKGDGQTDQRLVPAAKQWEALNALLWCLRPEILAIPASLASKMGPTPYGYDVNPESFPRWTSYSFDTLAAAGAAADMVLADLLNPNRCARIVEFHTRNTSLPALEQVLSKLESVLVKQPVGNAQAAEIAWTVQHVFLARLIQLGNSEQNSPGVRARAESAIRAFADKERILAKTDPIGHAAYLAGQASRYLNRRQSEGRPYTAPPAPIPGPPIGARDFERG